MEAFVSVIIPTFNRAHCIGSAVQSVFDQTFNNFELIVVDDGSTDATPELLAGFGDKLRILSQERAGPSAARNLGARMARGNLLAFLDSDDTWTPDKLEQQVELMANEGVILSATNWRGKDDVTGGTAFDFMPFKERWVCDRPTEFVSRQGGHNIMLSSWLVLRDHFLATGGFDPTLSAAEDNDLLFRLAFRGRFALTKKILLLRDTGLDDVKLTRPGNDLSYHRKLTRSMCLASGNAKILAFRESRVVQRQFGRIFSYYLRREMELAALDGDKWSARRRAFDVLLNHPSAKDAIMAGIGIISPYYICRLQRNKYPVYQKQS